MATTPLTAASQKPRTSRPFRWITRVALTVAMTATVMTATVLAAPSPAKAACAPNWGYDITGVTSVFVADKNNILYGGPNVTLSISVSKGTTFTGTVGGQVSGDLGSIVSAVQASVSTSISYSKTTTTTLSGSWKVPSNVSVGWIALGSFGNTGHWTYGHYNGSCVWVVSRSGTFTLPRLAPAISHS